MADNAFKNSMTSLMESMDGFLNTKTVVGDAVKVGNNIILPLADISFGAGSGIFSENAKVRQGGGMGAKISPSALLVINETGTKMISVKNNDAISKIIDMIPDIAAKFLKKKDAPDNTASDFAEFDEADIDQEVDL